MTIADTDGD